MSSDPVMRPDQATNPGEDYENTVSSHTGMGGPKAPARDKRPEAQYQRSDLAQGVNRTDDAAPKGPVNIAVKGNSETAGPDEAVKETPKATGRGSRDAPGLPQD
ncbi:hypothetical protein [Paracraurococcus ruber]|uniref:Uncharacterized protein n=1 Tax=Paracraurococcus ruber TaxID=77675 RepID=A0ABS1CV34_9PROT|nr:hypothetical protein [Paracraurococcus ruber]MBK1658380.1 hypothetical protein [Paracraurococcus ruber]TDG31050.1 hypothetical protein E2C05_12155 [Paracraurococcus ruber]